MCVNYPDKPTKFRYSLIKLLLRHIILKINTRFPHILYLPVAMVLFSGLISCSTLNTGSEDSNTSDSLKVRSSQPAKYKSQSDLVYEILVGELSGQFGDVDQALEHYVIAAKLTDDPAVAERATRIAMFAKDWDAGIKAASRWSELVGDNLEISQILGVLELRNANIDGAVPHFEKIMQAADDSPAKGFSIIGAVLSREEDSASALELLGRLVSKHYENAYGHLTLANLAFQVKDFQRTIDESEIALGFKSELVEARAMRAQALMSLGENEQALTEMQRVVKESPDNREMRMVYARMLITNEKYAEATEEFKKLLAENPNDGELIYRLGLLQLQQQQYDDAKLNFQRLVDRNQRSDEGHYYLGRVAEEQDEKQTAIDQYESVDQGQYYIDAKARIASLYADLYGVVRAQSYLKDLRSKLSTPESTIEVYLIEGQLLHDEKLYVAAMDLYSEGLQEFPGHSDLLYARALMAEEIDRIDLLEIDLKAILSENPDNASALNALGYTLADHNDRVNEALGYIQRALEIRPDDPAVIDSMGWVQFRLGNYAEAETYLRKAYDLLEDAEIAGHLAELLWAQGSRDEALELMQDGLKRYPEDEYLLELQQKFK